jgi:hypothetical protein
VEGQRFAILIARTRAFSILHWHSLAFAQICSYDLYVTYKTPNAVLNAKGICDKFYYFDCDGRTKSCGCMLILQRRAMQPESWRSVWTPSRIRICVKPISYQVC